MRILFSCLETHGHCYPLLPLAGAASEAGHEVVVATGEKLHPAVRAAGVRPVAAGISVERAFGTVAVDGSGAHPARLSPERRERLVEKLFGDVLPRGFFPDLRALLDTTGFDLVVYETANPGAALAAASAGVPAICHGFGRELAGSFTTVLEKQLSGYAGELGIALPENGGGTLGNPYVDVFPTSLQDPGVLELPNRVELRPVPFTESGELPVELTAPRPDSRLVYLTLGTGFGTAAVLRTALEGLAGLESTEVVVATGPSVTPEELGTPPDNVTVFSWLPQAKLFAHVDLVVHHGGSGTTLGALGEAVPQLFLPQGADQFDNSEVVSARGAGLRLLPDELDARSVAAAAESLLSTVGGSGALRSLASETRARPAPEKVVERFPEFVR